MPTINIIASLQSQISELEKIEEQAKFSYHSSCSEDDPQGCFMLMGHWEGASMELNNARWQLEQTIEAVSAALAAL